MKLEHIVFAVAAKADVDPSFAFEYVICRHIQSLLLKRTPLPTLALDAERHIYADTCEVHRCIDQAAKLLLRDLVRTNEISEAALARWQLTAAH
jgi:hypothetical protein